MNRPTRLKVVSSALALVFWAVSLVQPALSGNRSSKAKPYASWWAFPREVGLILAREF